MINARADTYIACECCSDACARRGRQDGPPTNALSTAATALAPFQFVLGLAELRKMPHHSQSIYYTAAAAAAKKSNCNDVRSVVTSMVVTLARTDADGRDG